MRTLRRGFGESSASAATTRAASAATRRADGRASHAPAARPARRSTRSLLDAGATREDAREDADVDPDARRRAADTVVTGARGVLTACVILSRDAEVCFGARFTSAHLRSRFLLSLPWRLCTISPGARYG